jgi:Domain of unknown function (DUF4145)
MKCPYCGIHFHDNWDENPFLRHNGRLTRISLKDAQKRNYMWRYRTADCPGCDGITIQIGTAWVTGQDRSSWARVQPRGANRGPVPDEIPPPIAQDYVEACNVLPVSAKASAALSRRCLQHMLRSHGYKAKDLANEIDLLLKETDPLKALPMRLRETIDAIRNFGNFAAHPNEDKATLEIINVEPHEAEWCLETIEELFEHFYVGPAIAAAKKAALNAKLFAGGKPQAKG